MNDQIINEVEDAEFENVEVTKMEVEKNIDPTLLEKKSFGTKVKEKVEKIGNITLKDAGKGLLKVGGIIIGSALLIDGARRVLGNNTVEEDDSEPSATITFTDEEGNEVEVVEI